MNAITKAIMQEINTLQRIKTMYNVINNVSNNARNKQAAKQNNVQ